MLATFPQGNKALSYRAGYSSLPRLHFSTSPFPRVALAPPALCFSPFGSPDLRRPLPVRRLLGRRPPRPQTVGRQARASPPKSKKNHHHSVSHRWVCIGEGPKSRSSRDVSSKYLSKDHFHRDGLAHGSSARNQGTTIIRPYWRKWMSNAKAVEMCSLPIRAKVVQSVKEKPLSRYR